VFGSWRSYSYGKLNREVAEHADILATILALKSATMFVPMSVSVSAPWNASLCPHVAPSGAAARQRIATHPAVRVIAPN